MNFQITGAPRARFPASFESDHVEDRSRVGAVENHKNELDGFVRDIKRRDLRRWKRVAVMLCLFSLLPLASTVEGQVTNVIYQDRFGRTGALNGSSPGPVDAGGAVWNAWAQLFTDGSAIIVTNASPAGGYNNAFLPFTPQAGHIYTLSAGIYGTSGGDWWQAFGYAQGAVMNDYYANSGCGAGWLLQRADDSQVQVFDGPGTAGVSSYSNSGNAVTNAYSIVLDTTAGTALTGWTIAFWENGTLLRKDTYSSNPSIGYVGLGAASATGKYLNFELTDVSFNRPIFTQRPPDSASVNEGGRLSVSAAVVGAPPLSYAWTNLSAAPPALLPGQTNATLILTNVSYAIFNNAQLQLTVTNLYGATNATTLVTVNTNFNPAVISDPVGRTVTMADGGSNLVLRLNYSGACYLDRVMVRGREVVAPDTGVCSAINVAGNWTTTRSGLVSPSVSVNGNVVVVSGIAYSGGGISVAEQWSFVVGANEISWQITRNYLNGGTIDDTYFPGWDFSSINLWTGGLLDTGGVAWGRFLTTGNSYGAHAGAVTFFDATDDVDLRVASSVSPGAQMAMRFSQQPSGYFSFVQSVATNVLATKYNLNRFNGTPDIWAPFHVDPGTVQVTLTLQVLDDAAVRGRGTFNGLDGGAVGDLMDTIGRYGVIDQRIAGGNGWLSGYVCLHEPFFAEMGLAIDDPGYTTNLAGALNDWRDHAEETNGRVKSRWHYDSGDSMPGTFDPVSGFYEAQWGYLLDSQPDYVINVSEEFDLTGDTNWLAAHKEPCERALNWLLARDSNTNGLVEMIPDSHTQGKSSDWIDIVWASYENALVNAELYEALNLWSERETILGDPARAASYSAAAIKLRDAFRLPVSQGGFWDSTNGWFVYWRDKDGSIHGDNLVEPVNFCAIAYGLADGNQRQMILDGMERRMRQENLFHWPLCFLPYAADEGAAGSNFPNYENGDIFLSWGEVGVRSYAGYDPGIAVAYINRVLDRYRQDGLSYQRYLRNSQTGAGDDVLAGNCMTIVGLYRDIYGVRPQWDRLRLDPHLTPELDGTQLSYWLRNQQYELTLGTNSSTIAVGGFSVQSTGSFAVNVASNQLDCFPTNLDQPVFSISRNSDAGVAMRVDEWPGTNGGCRWTISYPDQPAALRVVISGLKPYASYHLQTNGVGIATLTAGAEGRLGVDYPGATANPVTFELTLLPSIHAPVVIGNSVVLTGADATPGASYKLLTATNAATPLPLWTTNTSGVFDDAGGFSNEIPIASGEQGRFFRLKTP